MKLEKGTPCYAVCTRKETCDHDDRYVFGCSGNFFFNREEEIVVGQHLTYKAEHCPYEASGVQLRITHVNDAFIKFVQNFNRIQEKRYEQRNPE